MKKNFYLIIIASLAFTLSGILTSCATYESTENLIYTSTALLKSIGSPSQILSPEASAKMEAALKKLGISDNAEKTYSDISMETLQSAIIPTILSFEEKPNIIGGNVKYNDGKYAGYTASDLYKKGRERLIKFNPDLTKPLMLVASYKMKGFIFKKPANMYIYTIPQDDGSTKLFIWKWGQVHYTPSAFIGKLESNF